MVHNGAQIHPTRAPIVRPWSEGLVIDNVLVAADETAAGELETGAWKPKHDFINKVSAEAGALQAPHIHVTSPSRQPHFNLTSTARDPGSTLLGFSARN